MIEPTIDQIAESRTKAKELGLKFYYGPKPCKKGCIKPIRRTCNRHCLKCTNEYSRVWLTPERNRLKERLWRDRHREAYRAYQREYQKRWQAAKKLRAAESQRVVDGSHPI